MSEPLESFEEYIARVKINNASSRVITITEVDEDPTDPDPGEGTVDIDFSLDNYPTPYVRTLQNRGQERVSFLDAGGVLDDSTQGENNRGAMAELLGWVKANGGGKIHLPVVNGKGDFYFAAQEYVGGSYDSNGHYGRYGIVLTPDMHDIHITGDGKLSRIIRTDVTNTANDKYSAHVMVHGARACSFSEFSIKGLQNSNNVDVGTGGGIALHKGAKDIDIFRMWFEDCGAGAAIGIGGNRQPGETPQRVDVNTPCSDVRIGNIHVTNSRYFCVVVVAHNVSINGWRHRIADHQWEGVTQPGFIRRSLYLQACRNVNANDGRIFGVKKTGLLLAAYPQGQGYGELRDINLSNILIQGTDTSLFNENYIGLYFEDNNNITGGLGYQGMRDININNLTINDMVAGITCNDDDVAGATPDNYLFRGINLSNIKVNALSNGITISTTARTEMNMSNVQVNVFQNTVVSAALPNRGFLYENKDAGTKGLAADKFSTLRASNLVVRSGNRAGRLVGLDQSAFSNSSFSYVEDNVPNPRTVELEIASSKSIRSFDTLGGVTFTTMVGDSPWNFSAIPGKNGFGIGTGGIHTYRAGTGYRSHWTMHNDNDSVFEIGSSGDGAEFRLPKLTGVFKISNSTAVGLFEVQGELGKVNITPLALSDMNNMRIGNTTPADAKVTGMTIMALGVPVVDGVDGVVNGPTGKHSYRSGTSWRAHTSYHNNNGTTLIAGTNGNGGELRSGLLTSVSKLSSFAGTGLFTWTGDDKLAFYNATPVVKQAITGSKASGAALASLIAGLVATGLFTDSTTA